MDETNLYLAIVGALAVISALFSCSEAVIIAVSRAKIHRMVNDGVKGAKRIEKLLQKREKVISSMLMGNTAINIIASGLATSVSIELFGKNGVIYAAIGMTVLVLIFTEIAPKTIAIKAPEKIALFLAPLIDLLVTILFPLTYVTQKIVDSVINLLSFKSAKKDVASNLEEIRETLDFKAKEGTIFRYDKNLLDGVLDLSDTEISEIMVHRTEIESINIDLPISEILKLAIEISYTRIPLWKENEENVVAILNIRKFLKNLHLYKGDIEKFDLTTVTSKPWFIPETNSLRSQLFAFRKKKKRFALVVDEYGSLVGLVTLEDILEEIVGEIKEQEDAGTDNAAKTITKTKSGAYKVSGKTLIRDVNKKLDWNIDGSDEAYNMAAFIISSLGRIPEENESFIIDDYSFEILKKDNHDLVLIKIKRAA